MQTNVLLIRVLAGIKISSLSTLAEAVSVIHKTYSVPHLIITSVQLSKLLPGSSPAAAASAPSEASLTVIGSTTRSDGSPRLFRVDVPALDCYFSGTGDMFAALTVARLREAVFNDSDQNLRSTKSWVSSDSVQATHLPLAKATVKVLESMHSVLEKTLQARNAEIARATASGGDSSDALTEEDKRKQEVLLQSKAAEVRLVRNVRFLKAPTVQFKAQEWTE